MYQYSSQHEYSAEWFFRPIRLGQPRSDAEGGRVGMQEELPVKPFAIHLLEERRRGKSVEQLVRETGIPADRIEMRLNAASAYLRRLSVKEAAVTQHGTTRE